MLLVVTSMIDMNLAPLLEDDIIMKALQLFNPMEPDLAGARDRMKVMQDNKVLSAQPVR
jgi:hypothetical protein